MSVSEAYLYVVDLGTGQKREVDPAPGKVGIEGAKFSRDGQGVYLISDRDSEFAQLRYVKLFTAEKTDISGPIALGRRGARDLQDGHYLAYVTNEGGREQAEHARSAHAPGSGSAETAGGRHHRLA